MATPPSSIALDKNPFFHSINSFPGAELFIGLYLPMRSIFFNISFFEILFSKL